MHIHIEARAQLEGRTLLLTGSHVLKNVVDGEEHYLTEVRDIPCISVEVLPDKERLVHDIMMGIAQDHMELSGYHTHQAVGASVLLDIHRDAYRVGPSHRLWEIRICRRILSWHNSFLKSSMKLIGVPVEGHSVRRILPKIVTRAYWDLPVDLREWYVKDIDRLSTPELADFSVRLFRHLPKGVLCRYDLKTLLYSAGSAGNCNPRVVEMVVRYAFKDLNRKESRPWLAGALPKFQVPDTPWHYLLASTYYFAHSPRYLDGHQIGNHQWWSEHMGEALLIVPPHKAQKWISESSESIAISVLGWDFFTEDVRDLEKDLLTPGRVGWDHALSGMLRGKMPPKVEPVEPEEARPPRDIRRALEEALGGGEGARWVTVYDVLEKSLGYLRDGQELYEKYKGHTVEALGKTLRMQPIKGSFSRMLKDAHYNHNIERHFILSCQEDSSDPLWTPPEMAVDGGPLQAIEHLRVKTKGELRLIGKEAGHCVGNRVGSKRLFYHNGSSTAEVDYATLEVKECRGPYNRITADSQELRASIERAMWDSKAHLRAAVHKALMDDWEKENRASSSFLPTQATPSKHVVLVVACITYGDSVVTIIGLADECPSWVTENFSEVLA